MEEIWRTCKITNKSFNTARGFLNHLRGLKYTAKQYYDEFHNIENENICHCGKEKRYYNFRYRKYCSDVCSNRSLEHRNLVSKRFILNPNALEKFKNSRKNFKPNIEKRRQTIKDKCTELNISEYEYYSAHGKRGSLSITPEKRMAYTKKSMSTKSQTGKFGGRSGYKEYKFFDELVSLQGYEPIVLSCLIDEFKLGKHDIITGKQKIPIISYDLNKLYFPDFYLPQTNLLIEVKSSFTYETHKNIVLKKCDASVKTGYSIALLVLSNHEARNRKLDGSKKILDWAISSRAPNPTWYGEGSTTIL